MYFLCLFFYEWNQEKKKILFSAENNDLLYVGGFYRIHKNGAGFETESVIMTTTPSKSVEPIHDRMPFDYKEKMTSITGFQI